MSAIKRGSGLDYYMNSGLFGGSQIARNPGAQRERLINNMLERVIAELAINRFKYENVPDSIDVRFVELCLLLHGEVIWYKDFSFDKLIAVRGSGAGYVNFLDNPVSVTVIGPGTAINDSAVGGAAFMPKMLSAYVPTSDKEKSPEEKQKKAVIMYPNALRVPDIDIVTLYASKLSSIDRTLEINAKNARKTRYITASPNTQLSMVNVARQQDEGVELIQASASADVTNSIGVIDLGITPDAYDKLSVLRARWWNECMGLLGIDNANQDKKERLVAAEVGANDAQTDSMRFVALNARRQALGYINDVFGTNIKVDYNVEVEAQAQAQAEALGVENENSNTEKDGEEK